MRITKLKNGSIVIAEKLTVTTSAEVEAEAEVELDDKDLEEIRNNPFAHQFEFDAKGRLSKIKKGAKTISLKRIQNI